MRDPIKENKQALPKEAAGTKEAKLSKAKSKEARDPTKEALPKEPAGTKEAMKLTRANSKEAYEPAKEGFSAGKDAKEVHKTEASNGGSKANGNGKKSAAIEAAQNGIEKSPRMDETAGVGDKIKKFEKAAEDAGKGSRPGSVRRRRGSDELPPPPAATTRETENEKVTSPPPQPPKAVKWQKSDDNPKKPEPQKIIKPEFKPMQSLDMTIRSPSLGAKICDQFPSHGTAFRNVAPDAPRNDPHNDINTQKAKSKGKDKYNASVSKGSSYFTRGSEEIWLVKKKDIEAIEERVMDSFRRAGGNLCMREPRPSSDGGQGASMAHTMGRKRQMYARSESLDPQLAGARAQTLKRQTSVACTCGHDKKPRAKAIGEAPPRPRSRSHGDENNSQHVLDKFETLV